MRIESVRSPLTFTCATPGTVCSRGLTMRSMMFVTSSGLSVSDVNASQMTGNASASTFAITGSSTASGRRPRTRETRSRTSAAASSGLRASLKRTEIWLCSAREIDVSTSTPSMPAMESSSGFVTCDSMTSDDAPISLVFTVTTGSSMRGYSRTASRLYDTSADQDDQQRHDRGEDRPADGGLGDAHRSLLRRPTPERVGDGRRRAARPDRSRPPSRPGRRRASGSTALP